MAAKQGLTAQVYQASEDARRAVLSRAPPSVRSHSWLSNLNTTCTIKSAPPRTPEVMSMLSTKAGWLIKRNEQHVWQRRWCCVVPHSFLYYFEAEPIEAAAAKLNPISEKEESLASGHGHYESSNGVPPPSTTHGHSHSNQQPVGIIDLECYTTVERSSLDDDTLILELTGDAITNPDLRSFFFQGECEEDCERWTKAFLSDRHSALKDEREAYRQVCESFPLQLMHCSKMMDEAEDRQKGAERKAYSVRSAAEDSRKRVIQIVRDALEYEDHHNHNDPNHHHNNFIENKNKNNKNDEQLDEKRRRFLHKLDRLTSEAVNMNAGVSESVEILAQYADMLRVERARFNTELIDMNSRVKDLGHSMISKKEMEHKERQLGKLTQQHSNEKKRMNDRINVLDSMLKEEKQRSEDAERTLEAKNMEFTMLSAASKQKIQELSGHKKILKREVIELRQKLEDISSDATVYRHKTEGLDMQVKVEKERNSVLERHLDHVTGQIKMQERMMENMSLAMSGSQAGSVYDDRSRNGGDNHSHYNGSAAGAGFPPKTPGGNNSVYGRGSHSVTGGGGQNHNEIPKYPPRNVPPEITSKPVIIDNNNNNDNNNSNQFNSRPNNNNNDNDNNNNTNNPTNNSNTNARNINNNNNNNHDNSSQDDSYHSSQDSNHSSQDGIEALRNGRGTSNMMEDDESYEDDDDVSRGNLSELTEDRTFRAETIAGMLNNINVQKQQKKPEAIGVVSHGSSNIQDNSSSNPRLPKREVKSPTRNSNNNNNSNNNDDHHQQTLQHHPPPYVDESINSKTPTPIRRSNSRSDYREPHRPPRMTSNTNNPPNRKVIQNLPTPQSSSQQQQPHIHPDTISISMSSLGGASVTSYGSKLSVAQRARLEAELSPSKAVRVEIDTVLNNDDVEESHTTNNDAHHNPVSPSGGSVWSRLGKSLVDTIDNSVLAVKVPNEVGGGGGASVSSRDHRPVVEMEEKSVSHKSSQQQPPPQQQQPDKSLTLVQRMALQRDKQVAFLKQQGLLKEQQQRGSGGSVAGSVGSRRSQQHHHNDAGSLTGTSVSLSTGGGYRRGANV